MIGSDLTLPANCKASRLCFTYKNDVLPRGETLNINCYYVIQIQNITVTGIILYLFVLNCFIFFINIYETSIFFFTLDLYGYTVLI